MRWSEPVVIVKFNGENNVLLANPDTGVVIRRAHVSQLKRYVKWCVIMCMYPDVWVYVLICCLFVYYPPFFSCPMSAWKIQSRRPASFSITLWIYSVSSPRGSIPHGWLLPCYSGHRPPSLLSLLPSLDSPSLTCPDLSQPAVVGSCFCEL